MIRITKKITAAYEVRPINPASWIPSTSSASVRMASRVAEQWRNRQRSAAALRLNRQLSRS